MTATTSDPHATPAVVTVDSNEVVTATVGGDGRNPGDGDTGGGGLHRGGQDYGEDGGCVRVASADGPGDTESEVVTSHGRGLAAIR